MTARDCVRDAQAPGRRAAGVRTPGACCRPRHARSSRHACEAVSSILRLFQGAVGCDHASQARVTVSKRQAGFHQSPALRPRVDAQVSSSAGSAASQLTGASAFISASVFCLICKGRICCCEAGRTKSDQGRETGSEAEKSDPRQRNRVRDREIGSEAEKLDQGREMELEAEKSDQGRETGSGWRAPS